MLVKKPYIVDFGTFGDEDSGFYSRAEFATSLPFEPKRIYWMYGTPDDTSRGNVAHISTRLVIVPLVGVASIYLEDLKGSSYEYVLKENNKGLFIPEKTWRRIGVSPGTILLTFASEKYNQKDRIEDFRMFKKLKKR